jgi:hypothetical protein
MTRAPGRGARATTQLRKADDRPSNSAKAPNPQDLIPGLAGGSDGDDDFAWFARHRGRNYRLRPAIGTEVALCAPSPSGGRYHGWTAVFAVQKTQSGDVIRLPVPWPPGTPLLGEQRAKAVFDWSAQMFARQGKTPADVEAHLCLAILRSTS